MPINSDRPSNGVSSSTNPNSQSFLIPRDQRRRFFIQFTLMSILGWVVGGIASIAVEKTIAEVLSPAVVQQPTWYALGKYTSSVAFAAIFSADQALVLRQYVSGWLWMIGTSIGWLISSGVSAAWINYISSIALSFDRMLTFEETAILGILSTLAYILSGIWLGFCQWLVLQRYTPKTWWWNFLPSISFLFISISVWLLSLVQEFISVVNRDQVLYLSEQGITAVILGVTPAIGLCVLKRGVRV
ncbi:MAG: hypothetical protein SAK29_01760 [Scytonema sp. PMC 1069.18]|nr:hypothetical protein [Scytonema sp. PMC 1069.18]MEC4884167.1 hypothetical protein [Scytonema sp. PMC 1070.18]